MHYSGKYMENTINLTPRNYLMTSNITKQYICQWHTNAMGKEELDGWFMNEQFTTTLNGKLKCYEGKKERKKV